MYVIGTEVPLPGGQQEANEHVIATSEADIADTIRIFKDTFFREGLESAWNRVIAVVVQPGVEFGEEEIIEYRRGKSCPFKEVH